MALTLAQATAALHTAERRYVDGYPGSGPALSAAAEAYCEAEDQAAGR
jgi:hypothetical protein